MHFFLERKAASTLCQGQAWCISLMMMMSLWMMMMMMMMVTKTEKIKNIFWSCQRSAIVRLFNVIVNCSMPRRVLIIFAKILHQKTIWERKAGRTSMIYYHYFFLLANLIITDSLLVAFDGSSIDIGSIQSWYTNSPQTVWSWLGYG